MTLRAALRERALLSEAFGHRKLRIVRAPKVRPARYAHAAQMAYLRGLLDVVAVIERALKTHVIPQLPRLVQAHAAAMRVVHDALEPRLRIAIVGVPGAGKTTAARALAAHSGLPVHSSDDLIALGWSEASAAAAALIESGAASGGIFEGVAVIRALRKLLERSHDKHDKPVDHVVAMLEPRERLTAGQQAMAEGVRTIARAVLPRLAARGVNVVYDPAQLALPTPRKDEADDDVDGLFAAAANDVEQQAPRGRITLLAQQNAVRVDEHVKGELTAQVRSVVAIDLQHPDTGVPQHVRNFVAQQVTLIKGLKAQTLAKTHSVVLEGIRQGLRAEEIAKRLHEEVKLSKTRATIIANDQIGKLHGELTRMRQTALGIKRYRWATSRDELVRPGHRALEATVQSWDSPPVVNAKTGKRAHPGFDTHFWPCRCSAIPIIDDLLEDAGLLTVPPPPPANTNDPANTNTPANQNAPRKRAKPAKPAPPPLPPEHTPAFWAPHFRPAYGDAAPQVAWGRAMAERGRAMPLKDFHDGVDTLRKLGIEAPDIRQFSFAKNVISSAKPKSVGELLDAIVGDPKVKEVHRTIAREVELAAKLVAHQSALAGQTKRLVLDNPVSLSARNVTQARVDAARDRARRIYEALSHKDVPQPTAYKWSANHEDRGSHQAPRAGVRAGTINLGAAKANITDEQLLQTTLHEWGHALEALSDSRLAAAIDFLEARAGTEAVRPLADIPGYEQYARSERGIADKLFDAYQGKAYPASSWSQRQAHKGREASEVTAMVVQHLHDVTVLQRQVAAKDPEVIDWLLGQLANQ